MIDLSTSDIASFVGKRAVLRRTFDERGVTYTETVVIRVRSVFPFSPDERSSATHLFMGTEKSRRMYNHFEGLPSERDYLIITASDPIGFSVPDPWTLMNILQ